MLFEERHKDSLRIAREEVSHQLGAMACACFELGLLRADGVMLLRAPLTANQIEAQLTWLRRENARGAHIFVRPHGFSRLTLIDDLNEEALATMTVCGFAPALVVETSPGNFQAWVKHARALGSSRLSTVAARALATRFGGDLSSAASRHFGRLAGFTNQKFKRRLASGMQPFVRLRQWSGCTFPAAEQFLVEVERLAVCAQQEYQAHAYPGRRSGPLREVAEFHCNPRYGGDLHRADLAWACYAAVHGLGATEIAAALGAARDLSKKGAIRRQLAYANRTANKAISNLTVAGGAMPPADAKVRGGLRLSVQRRNNMSLNRAMVMGNLGADPELRHLNDGRTVANLSVATSEFFIGTGGQKRRTAVEWHRVVVFGKLAESCCHYLKKGSPVFVEGRLRTRSFPSTADGGKRERTEIVASRLGFLQRMAGADQILDQPTETEGEEDSRPDQVNAAQASQGAGAKCW
jgi:single stranded DNA-binding protein